MPHRAAGALLIVHLAVAAMWLVLVCYWLVSASKAKPNVTRQRYYGLPLRVALIALIIVLLRSPQLRLWLRQARAVLMPHGSVALIGLALCALGLGLAMAARIQLGRNWGMPMSQKVEPQLVTGGPYAYARHPIYGGLMLGMLGSALSDDLFWALPLLLFTPYFIVSALREEKLMLEQFPAEYEEYRSRTKLLIPFVI
ncbi:MAG TPA: isoprenylcysteine carboxylmethyltransferase family protein [Steroidobacteraceae bacterium]|nr:isoprenylcysteine carboxylmethyltransferase family protein [Steroidobacteraceae bacterium]